LLTEGIFFGMGVTAAQAQGIFSGNNPGDEEIALPRLFVPYCRSFVNNYRQQGTMRVFIFP